MAIDILSIFFLLVYFDCQVITEGILFVQRSVIRVPQMAR